MNGAGLEKASLVELSMTTDTSGVWGQCLRVCCSNKFFFPIVVQASCLQKTFRKISGLEACTTTPDCPSGLEFDI
jgi:hypothetical protein